MNCAMAWRKRGRGERRGHCALDMSETDFRLLSTQIETRHPSWCLLFGHCDASLIETGNQVVSVLNLKFLT